MPALYVGRYLAAIATFKTASFRDVLRVPIEPKKSCDPNLDDIVPNDTVQWNLLWLNRMSKEMPDPLQLRVNGIFEGQQR
jgi:hypothetical protein